jgi:hypothetical protein
MALDLQSAKKLYPYRFNVHRQYESCFHTGPVLKLCLEFYATASVSDASINRKISWLALVTEVKCELACINSSFT